MPRAYLLPAATALAALTAAVLLATALSLRPPRLVAVVGTVEAVDSSTGTPELTVGPTRGVAAAPAPPATPRVGDIPVQLAIGTVILRVTRLIVPPGVALPPTPSPVTTVLLVETGTLSVVVDARGLAGWGLDPTQFDAPLSAGERLVVVPGARYAVRNDGPTLVEALAVTVVPGDAPEPLPASG